MADESKLKKDEFTLQKFESCLGHPNVVVLDVSENLSSAIPEHVNGATHVPSNQFSQKWDTVTRLVLNKNIVIVYSRGDKKKMDKCYKKLEEMQEDLMIESLKKIHINNKDDLPWKCLCKGMQCGKSGKKV